MLDHVAIVRELALPEGSYIVVGASSMVVRRIRESNDIDILVTEKVFEDLRSQGFELDRGFEERWNRRRLKRETFEIYENMFLESEQRFIAAEEMIATAEYIEGIPFLSLEHLVMFKRDSGRPKDLADIALIEAYLEGSRGL